MLIGLGRGAEVRIAKWGDLKWMNVQTAFHNILPYASKVTGGCQTQVHGTINVCPYYKNTKGNLEIVTELVKMLQFTFQL